MSSAGFLGWTSLVEEIISIRAQSAGGKYLRQKGP